VRPRRRKRRRPDAPKITPGQNDRQVNIRLNERLVLRVETVVSFQRLDRKNKKRIKSLKDFTARAYRCYLRHLERRGVAGA
jgi:hypothetical protein